jgi:hypothetical protein
VRGQRGTLARGPEREHTLHGEPIAIADLLRDNDWLDDVDAEAIAAMRVGDELTCGGEAFAEFVLRRIV